MWSLRMECTCTLLFSGTKSPSRSIQVPYCWCQTQGPPAHLYTPFEPGTLVSCTWDETGCLLIITQGHIQSDIAHQYIADLPDLSSDAEHENSDWEVGSVHMRDPNDLASDSESAYSTDNRASSLSSSTSNNEHTPKEVAMSATKEVSLKIQTDKIKIESSI